MSKSIDLNSFPIRYPSQSQSQSQSQLHPYPIHMNFKNSNPPGAFHVQHQKKILILCPSLPPHVNRHRSRTHALTLALLALRIWRSAVRSGRRRRTGGCGGGRGRACFGVGGGAVGCWGWRRGRGKNGASRGWWREGIGGRWWWRRGKSVTTCRRGRWWWETGTSWGGRGWETGSCRRWRRRKSSVRRGGGID